MPNFTPSETLFLCVCASVAGYAFCKVIEHVADYIEERRYQRLRKQLREFEEERNELLK